MKKRKPLAGQPNADPKDNELDGFLLSQLKQRRLKANKRGSKPKNGEPVPAANGKEGKQPKKSSQEDSMKEYLDMKREETASNNDGSRMNFDFDESLFDSLNKDDLSHLFLQNDNNSVLRFPLED